MGHRRLRTESGDMLAVAQRNGYHPGMAFHTAFMALGYGEGKRVVTGVAADFPCQNGVVGLDCGFIEYVATGTGLKQYGVEVGGFPPLSARSRSPNANRLSAYLTNANTFLIPDTLRPKNT